MPSLYRNGQRSKPTIEELAKAVEQLKDEDRWKAESDARAMVQAREVRADPVRLDRARLVADYNAAVAARDAKSVK